MANERLHLIHLHSETVKVPSGSTADLRYGEIAVQYAASDPALYIKKSDDTFAKFVPNIDISGATTGSGNVITGISVSNNTVTAAKGNAVQTATGDTLISATVSGGTKVVISATTALSQSVVESHHDNRDVLDGISSGDVANWNAAYASAHTHTNKALLDTYTQTEANLADAVAKKHEHTNKTVLDGIASGDVANWNAAYASAHTHENKDVLDDITSGDVANWDAAYTDMLTGITKGTDGTFVTTTVGAKSNKSQSVSVSVTTAATSAATSSANGLATAYETKQYIDSKTTNIKNVTTIDGKALSSSADTFAIATGNSLLTKSTAQSGASITTTLGLVTGATSSSTAGLAVNTDVKDYVDKASITGDGFVIGASGLSVSHKAYSVTNTAKTASPAHGGTFVAISDIKYDGHGHVSAATATTVTLPSETQLSKGTDTGSGNVVTDLSVSNHQITLTKGITALTAVTATGDSYVDASVASNSAITVGLKSVAASKEAIAQASTTGSVVDAKAVKEYVEAQVTSSVNYCGSTPSLPSSANVGDLYIASGEIAIASGRSGSGVAATAETGDYLICRNSGTTASKWDVIEKNLTGAVTAGVDLTSDAIVVGNGNQTVKVASAKGSATNPIYIDASGKPQTANTIHDVAASGTTAAASALTWNTESVLGAVKVDNTTYTFKVKMPADPNTDYSGTTEELHYEPSTTAETIGSSTGNNYIRGINVDSKNHVISVVTGTPTNTKYTFASGATGFFTVTPTGGNAQTVSIGKPASAGTADDAVHASAATKVDSALTITYADGTASKTYDGSAAVSIEIPAVTAVTVTDGTNALAWNTDKTLATINVGGTDYVINAKLPANPNTDTACTMNGHYAPSASASTAGTATTFIRQIVLDSKKHVTGVVTGSPAAVAVVDCASTITTASTTLGTIDGNAITAKIDVTNSGATIPMSASTATTLATVGGVNITAKTSMNKLSIAGAAANAGTAEFDGKSDVTITVLDCGEY